MKLTELQKDWDTFGRRDPYWAILTYEGKAGNRWDPEEFFRTAEREVASVLDAVATLGVSTRFGRALDFGCGVGRLTQALCRRFETCHGVDIAPSMIALAQKHNRHGSACTYSVNDSDDLAGLPDASFDFVLSLLVLQHIEPAHAARYLAELLRVLAPGGVLVFQLPTERISSPGLTVIDHPLPDAGFRAEIVPCSPPSRLAPCSSATLRATVINRGSTMWPAVGISGPGPFAIHLGNHWLTSDGQMVVADDGRAPLPADVVSEAEVELTLIVKPPAEPGRYLLELDMVQEGVSWFAGKGSRTTRLAIDVVKRSRLAGLLDRVLGRPASGVAAAPRMEMHGIPKARVTEILEQAGGRVLAIEEDGAAGPRWRSLRYYVTRSVSPSSSA